MHNSYPHFNIIIMKKLFTYFATLVAMSMFVLSCEKDPKPEPGDTTVKVSSVSVTASATTVEVGGAVQVTATVLPENATDKSVTWSSSQESVATVNSLGLVTAVSAGETVITATAGEVTGNVTITVTEPVVTYDPKLSSLVENYEEVSEGVYVAELPLAAGYSFAGEFDFKDLFENLPDGTTFSLASVDQQNSEVAEYYEALVSNLAADGKWTRNERFASDLNVSDENNTTNGVRVVLSVDGNAIMTVNFYIVDPIIGLERSNDDGHERLKIEWIDKLVGWHGAYGGLEMEIGGSTNWQQMALKHGDGNDINLALFFNDVTNFQDQGPYFHGEDVDKTFFKNWPVFSVSGTNGEEIFFNDTKNGKLALSEYGANLCKASKGIVWQLAWACYVNCCNWQLPEPERPVPSVGGIAETAAVGGKMDYVMEGDAFRDVVGIYLTEDGHIKTTAEYKGAGARISPRIVFEYDYGSVAVTQRYMCMIFLNRRWAAEGEIADVTLPSK